MLDAGYKTYEIAEKLKMQTYVVNRMRERLRESKKPAHSNYSKFAPESWLKR
jgi:hypothetical protein